MNIIYWLLQVRHIAYIPTEKILGLSKFSRIVDIFAWRLITNSRKIDLSNSGGFFNDLLKHKGVIVKIAKVNKIIINFKICHIFYFDIRGVEESNSYMDIMSSFGYFYNFKLISLYNK